MHFRHPEHLDTQRFHHDLSDRPHLSLHRPADGLLWLLGAVALTGLLAVVSLAAQGSSLTRLLVISGAFLALLLLQARAKAKHL